MAPKQIAPRRTKDAIDQSLAAPRSKAKAVRAYWWDMEKVRSNRGTPEYRAQYETAQGLFSESQERAREIGWSGTVREICFACVGGDPNDPADGARRQPDPPSRVAIRDCRCTGCPLHPVRVWRLPQRLQPAAQAAQAGQSAEAVVPRGAGHSQTGKPEHD